MTRAAVACLWAAAVVSATAAEPLRPEMTRAEWEWLGGVHSALQHRDCPRVLSRLNDGLAERYPDAYMVAGTLYEEGLCLKPQWERAVTMYQRALAAGHRGGRYRLIAGHARRDPAVALWWAQEGAVLSLPVACRVPAETHRDADAFAAALQAWPADRLPACTYMAGVMATILGEVEFPGDALGMLMEGRLAMSFVPSEGRIDWRTVELTRLEPSGLQRGERILERDSNRARETLRNYLQESGERALRRFQRPPGIDGSWRAEIEYAFSIR